MSRKNYNKLTDWEKVYQLPLHQDKYGSYAWSKNGTMSLMFKNVAKEDRQKIIDSINGVEKHKVKGLTNDNHIFLIDGQESFFVRGWGNLTGTGALNYSPEKAVKIQDGFIKHINDKLQP
jgi:hypothetical protein